MQAYSSNKITEKELKSDNRLSKFDWHDLSTIFWALILLYNLKAFQKPMEHHLLAMIQ